MNFNKVIGIDPGSGGGIAVFSKSGIGCSKMPIIVTEKTVKGKVKKSSHTDISEIARILKEQKEGCNPIVFLEKVQAWTSDIDVNPGKRFMIQKLLNNYQSLKTAIIMSGIPLIEVIPRSWQTYLALVVQGADKTVRKNMYKRAAKQYYPEADVSLWNADAICLVQFGRMKLKLDPDWIRDRIKSSDSQSSIFE